MRFNISIREKLVVYFVSLGILAIILVGVYSFSSARKAIIERSFHQLTSIKEVKKDRLHRFFLDRNRDLGYISDSEEIAKMLKSMYAKTDILLEKDSFSTRLTDDFLKKGNYFSKLIISDTNGCYIELKTNKKHAFIKNEFQSKSPYKDLLIKIKRFNQTCIQDFTTNDSSSTLLIGAPIKNTKNQTIGTIILAIPQNAINEIMYEDKAHTGIGESGESYLVGSDYIMRTESRFNKNSALFQSVKTESVINALNGNSGTKVLKDYRNITVLSSYSLINVRGIRWVILVEIDFKEVMTPIYKIRNDIILMSSFISMTFFFVSFMISKRITDPLIRLSKATMEIASGKYGKKLPIEYADEIGELTESFNTMSVQIREQTKELKEREKRLNHFYEATTDGIILHDRGVPVLVNQAICKLTYYSQSELLQLLIGEIFSISDYESYIMHPNKSFSYETLCYRKDGTFFHIEIQEKPIEFEGKIISSSVIRDISERIEAEEAIKRERQKRLSSFIDGQEDERKRISRELHDGLGQVLIGIKMRLEGVKFNNLEKDRETVDFLKDLTSQTVKEVRRISNALMPSALRELGLVMAINNLCKQVEQNHNKEINFDFDDSVNFDDDRIKMYLYRVIQEALNNAVKHSGATCIKVILKLENNNLHLIIEDNGEGFDIASLQNSGNGLHNMKERIQLLNGKIKIISGIGEGTIINARIPLV
ncbi:MAG: PAS domain S-box protein [Bacteroidales bacterium]|nr:PAS domain S-box protein [Bacteroidales bacterium]